MASRFKVRTSSAKAKNKTKQQQQRGRKTDLSDGRDPFFSDGRAVRDGEELKERERVGQGEDACYRRNRLRYSPLQT